jgi:uncharacterized protein
MKTLTDRTSPPTCTAFRGDTVLAAGPLAEIALFVKDAGGPDGVLAFDDETGTVIDLDLRGSNADILARYPDPQPTDEARSEARGRGRPKLGVVAREVTLLPRHWDWLSSQPGGASVVLRRLVEQERRAGDTKHQRRSAQEAAYKFMTKHQRRSAQEAAYKFMSAMGGDLPGFEEATRALFANDRGRFEEQISGWPRDIRAYAVRLAKMAD